LNRNGNIERTGELFPCGTTELLIRTRIAAVPAGRPGRPGPERPPAIPVRHPPAPETRPPDGRPERNPRTGHRRPPRTAQHGTGTRFPVTPPRNRRPEPDLP